MTTISLIEEKDAPAEVATIYQDIRRTFGMPFVPNLFKAIAHNPGYSFSPPLLEAFVANISYFRGGTPLSPVLTTMIRYLVSVDAGCQFCIDLNESFLSHLGVDIERARHARNNPALAPVDERELPLLKLALRCVDDPDAISAEDLQEARKLGWNNREIFDAVVQAANNRAFNYVLRTFKVERQGVFA